MDHKYSMKYYLTTTAKLAKFAHTVRKGPYCTFVTCRLIFSVDPSRFRPSFASFYQLIYRVFKYRNCCQYETWGGSSTVAKNLPLGCLQPETEWLVM